MDEAVPEGFRPHFRKSPVTAPWEPLFSRSSDTICEIGVRLAEAHCNSRGFAHGAVIAALADNAMGLSYGRTAKAAGTEMEAAVTVSLSVDYAASARSGQWLQIEPRIIKAGRTIGFVDALITADGAVIARSSGTFRAV